MGKRTWGAIVCGLALSVSSLAFGQEKKLEIRTNKPEVQQKGDKVVETTKRVETSATGFRRSSLLIGTNVSLQGGTRYGKIHEFVISEQGCIDYVIVSHDNRFIPVPWSVTTYDADQRVVMLDIEQDRIKTIPTYVEYTEFTNPAFVTKYNAFYNADVRNRDSDRSRPRDSKRDDLPGDRPGTRKQTVPDSTPDAVKLPTEKKAEIKIDKKPE